MRTLPILDLSLLSGSADDAARFRDELRRATHEIGFFYLVGHGLPPEFFDRMMATARDFFALPVEAKLAIENTHSPHFRGYTRMGGELTQGATDWREQIDIGAERDAVSLGDGVPDFWALEGPNLWPAELPALRDVTVDWMDRLGAISVTLLRSWAEALGAPADTFDAAFAGNASPHLKIARYPGRERTEGTQGVGAHKDLGVLTLLYVEDGKGGLQVEKDGEWIDAPPVPGAFVVNIGELLEIATNGYLKATLHRVQSPEADDERISVPFFFGPALDAEIPTIDLPAELAAEAAGVTRDPSNPLHPVFGVNWLKSRVRSHPNVVEAHYPHWS